MPTLDHERAMEIARHVTEQMVLYPSSRQTSRPVKRGLFDQDVGYLAAVLETVAVAGDYAPARREGG